MKRRFVAAELAMLAGAAASTPMAVAAQDAKAPSFRERLPEDDIIYFLLPDRFENGDPANDRGGLSGDRLKTGYDPTAKGFYHGGDLKGVIRRLDYIQRLGATAIWVAPIFANKPVQGAPGHETAGYHGYWITDFTRVDPHFGTNADFRALVDAAHARGIKVYMDIVINHTADVIKYRECRPDEHCPYHGRAEYPYQRRGGVAGAPINPGFNGDTDGTAANFARLTDPTYAYTPYIPRGEEHAKTPDWLNDITLYHNRGDTDWTGESAQLGDFSGLDDLMTENPRVVAGMIDIFGGWIDRFGIDGFRIDTARHVDAAFWQQFVPAMQARAKADGIPNFHLFGEVATAAFDPALLARHTRVDKLPAVLDFAFARAVVDAVAGAKGNAVLAELFQDDVLYDGGTAAARRLPTFLGNHDGGRFAMFVRKADPTRNPAEQLARVKLGYAMLLTLRGIPTIYAGDEQGFVGQGEDQDARQDMFGSQVASYNQDSLIGTGATTATPRFDENHPLYREIATLARLRAAHPALRRGETIVRAVDDKPGLFAVGRRDAESGERVLLAFNSSTQPITRAIAIGTDIVGFQSLAGDCPATVTAPGSVIITLPPLGYAICQGRTRL